MAASSPCSTNQTGVPAGSVAGRRPDSTESHGGPPSGTKVARSSSYRSPPPIDRQSAEVRVPAAGDREQIDVERLLAAVGVPDEDPFEPLPAQCLDHQLARTRVDRPHDVDAGLQQDVGDSEAQVVRGERPPRVRPGSTP